VPSPKFEDAKIEKILHFICIFEPSALKNFRSTAKIKGFILYCSHLFVFLQMNNIMNF